MVIHVNNEKFMIDDAKMSNLVAKFLAWSDKVNKQAKELYKCYYENNYGELETVQDEIEKLRN